MTKSTFIFFGHGCRFQFRMWAVLLLLTVGSVVTRAVEPDNKNTFVVGKFIFMIGADAGVGDGEAWLVGVKPGVELTGEITIPGSAVIAGTRYEVTRIGSFPEAYTEMWWYDYDAAIANHPGITKVTIPSTIQRIEVEEFLGCSGITEFHVNAANKYFKDDNGILFCRNDYNPASRDWNLFRMPPATKKTKYTVPAGTRIIHNNAFADNKSIKTLILGGNLLFSRFWANRNLGISSIDVSAASIYDEMAGVIYFKESWYLDDDAPVGKFGAVKTFPPALVLDKLSLPQSVKYIDGGAFANTRISEIVIPDDIKSVGKYAFYNSKLKTLRLSVDNIGYQDDFDGMCLDCKMLDSVELAGSSGHELLIDANMFRGCESLKSLTIGSNKVTLGSYAFFGCKSLTTFQFSKVTGWHTGYFDEEGGYQFAYSGLLSARIPSGLRIVPRGMFMGSDLMTVNLNPSGKNTLGTILNDAFRDCKLTEVNLESVTDLRKNCFVGNPLKKVIFPCKQDEDEYSGGSIVLDHSFEPTEETWFYVGNQRIEWDDHDYDWNGKYEMGLEKAVYVSSARNCINVPDNFRTVYGPSGCKDNFKGKGEYKGETAGIKSGDVHEIFNAVPVPGLTAFEITQNAESSGLSFKVDSLYINGKEADRTGNIWRVPGSVSPLAYDQRLHYTVNGVEMITFYPKNLNTDTSVGEIGNGGVEREIVFIHDLLGCKVSDDLNGLNPGTYVITYSDGTTAKITR